MNELMNPKDALMDLKNTQALCDALMKTPHYQKMGPEGIFAIVQKAQSLGLSPLEALNGGMYYVQGKVEMQAILMAKMIRSKGHSITMGKDSNKEQCTLHGRRQDNGDTWKVTFSIQDAKNAQIYKGAWFKYPEDMLYSRALSRLARQLFPDVIGNCYVEGEISQDDRIMKELEVNKDPDPIEVEIQDPTLEERIGKGEVKYLEKLLEEDEEYRSRLLTWIKERFNAHGFEELPQKHYKQILSKVEEKMFSQNEEEFQEIYIEESGV